MVDTLIDPRDGSAPTGDTLAVPARWIEPGDIWEPGTTGRVRWCPTSILWQPDGADSWHLTEECEFEPQRPFVFTHDTREGLAVLLKVHGHETLLMRVGTPARDSLVQLIGHLQTHYLSPVDEPAYFTARRALHGLGWEPRPCASCSGLSADRYAGGLDAGCRDCGGFGHVWRRVHEKDPVTP